MRAPRLVKPVFSGPAGAIQWYRVRHSAWLAAGVPLTVSPVDIPDLQALQNGDPDAWDIAYECLGVVALNVAQRKLGELLPDAAEDVAMETLEALVEKVRGMKSPDELKPMTASIAHNLSVTRLREHLAQKRGGGRTQSLDAVNAEGERLEDPPAPESPLNSLDQAELGGLLGSLLREL